MDHYGINMEGPINIERLASLSSWIATDVGRVVFVIDENVYYGGGNSAWILIGSVSDLVYSSSWNGVVDVSPSKNAVYDKIEDLEDSINSIEIGTCESGVTKTLDNSYTSPPSIMLTPASMPTYDADSSAQDQKIVIDADDLTLISENTYSFMPKCDLVLDSGVGGKTVDEYKSKLVSDTYGNLGTWTFTTTEFTDIEPNTRDLTANITATGLVENYTNPGVSISSTWWSYYIKLQVWTGSVWEDSGWSANYHPHNTSHVFNLNVTTLADITKIRLYGSCTTSGYGVNYPTCPTSYVAARLNSYTSILTGSSALQSGTLTYMAV